MSVDELLEAALHLPPEERRDLATRLAESVVDDAVAIPAWHAEEIDRAIAEAESAPDDVETLEAFQRRMDARFRK